MAEIAKVSSIVNIAGIGFQTSIALNTYSRGKDVPSNIHALARTITSFALSLKQCAAFLQSPKSISTPKAADAAQRIAKSSIRVLDEVDDMLEDAQGSTEDGPRSPSEDRPYIESCFEKRRVQYLLAHLRSLELSLALLLQIMQVGRKLDLLYTSNDEEQQNVNLLAAEQERIVAQDILFVRQVQTDEVYRTYGVLQQIVERGIANSSSPIERGHAASINSTWVPLYALGSIEGELRNLFDAEDTMSSVSQHVILFLLGEWTTSGSDTSQPVSSAPANWSDGEEEDYYESEYDEYSDEDRQDYEGSSGNKPQQHWSPDRPQSNGRRYSVGRDDPRGNRRQSRRPSRLSQRSDSRSRSEDSEREDNRSRRRSSRRPRHDSEDGYRQSHTRRHDSVEHRGRSHSKDRRESSSSKSKPKQDTKSDQPSQDPASEKGQEEPKKEDDGKNEENKKTDDAKADGESKNPDNKDSDMIKIHPLAAMLFPTLMNQLRSGGDKKEDKKDTKDNEKPQPTPNAATTNVTPIAQATNATVPPIPLPSGQKIPSKSAVQPQQPPRTSPRLNTANPVPLAQSQQGRYSTGVPIISTPVPTHTSTAAQKYTPQPLSQDRRYAGSVAPGYVTQSAQPSTAPVTQYAVQDPHVSQRQRFQLPPPPHDRYGSDRVHTTRPQGYIGGTSAYHRPSSIDHRRDSTGQPPSPHPSSAYHDDRYHQDTGRLPSRPSPSSQYLSPTHRHESRPGRQDHLSQEDRYARRHSLPGDRLEAHSSHHPTSPLRRPSRSPSDERRSERRPSRDSRRRQSPPSTSRPRRSKSRTRDEDRYDRPYNSRPSSRPTSQQSARPATGGLRPSPASRKDYNYKPSTSRVKIKPANARAASRMLGPVMKGLSAFGKGLRR